MSNHIIHEDVFALDGDVLADFDAHDPVEAPFEVDGSPEFQLLDFSSAHFLNVGASVVAWKWLLIRSYGGMEWFREDMSSGNVSNYFYFITIVKE